MVVHSADGLDEISPAASTHAWVVERRRGHRADDLARRTSAVARIPLAAVSWAATPAENAATLRAVLGGDDGPMADFVVMNAAAALFVAGDRGATLDTGAEMAREAIASGAAREVTGAVRGADDRRSRGG